MNAPEAYISCRLLPPEEREGVDCIPMSAQEIGSVTGLLSIGGVITAFFAGNIAAYLGRRKTSLLTCIPFILGSLITGSALKVWQLQLGRFISGLGAGAAIVIVPIYLAEIGPATHRGKLGFFSQIAINIGILLAQVLGIMFSNYTQWRYIIFAGAIIGLVYAVTLTLFAVESPKWFVSVGSNKSAIETLKYLRDMDNVDEEIVSLGGTASKVNAHDEIQDTTSLLSSHDPENVTTIVESAKNDVVSISSFLFGRQYRSSLIVVAGIMMAQQFCGVNSIIFYGVSVLAKLFPEWTKAINCFISILNTIVTLYSSTIVDHYGRKPLLISSISGMAVSAFLLGFGITHELSVMSAVAATLFVVAFAVGLGPIPFMIISELVPHNAVGAAQSVGTTANWLSTFLIGYTFPILQVSLGGYTYYIFTLFCILSVLFVVIMVPSDDKMKQARANVPEILVTSSEE